MPNTGIGSVSSIMNDSAIVTDRAFVTDRAIMAYCHTANIGADFGTDGAAMADSGVVTSVIMADSDGVTNKTVMTDTAGVISSAVMADSDVIASAIVADSDAAIKSDVIFPRMFDIIYIRAEFLFESGNVVTAIQSIVVETVSHRVERPNLLFSQI